MAIQETHVGMKDVNILINPEASFVSTVQYAANQIPFKVVKTQQLATKEGSMKVIHTILAPKGTDPAVIQSCLGEELKSTFKSDAQDTATSVSFLQHPREAFKEDTFEMISIDAEHDIKAIVGIPKDEEKSGVLGKLFKQKSEVIMVDDEMPSIPAEDVVKWMNYQVYDEITHMTTAITGILDQTEGDAKSKIKAVQGIWKNFMAYLDTALTVTKGEALHIAPKEETKTNEESVSTETQKGNEIMADETKTEAAAAPADDVVKTETEAKTEETAAVEEDAKKADTAQQMAEMKEMLVAMTAKFEAMSGEVKKMQELVPGTVTDLKSDEVVAEVAVAKKGDFTGALFGNRS